MYVCMKTIEEKKLDFCNKGLDPGQEGLSDW